MFGKGNDFVFKIGNDKGLVIQLTAEEAIGHGKQKQANSPHYFLLNPSSLFISRPNHICSVAMRRTRTDNPPGQCRRVKVMLNRKALQTTDYLKDLMKVIQIDGLSGYELRFINKLKPADYKKLPDQIDEYYINRIIETCNHVDDGEGSQSF